MAVTILKRVLISVAIIFIFFLAARMVVTLAKRANEAYSAREKSLSAAEASWQPFHSVVGNFSALFPEAPAHTHDEASFLGDTAVTLYDTYIVEDADHIFYTVTVVRYPPLVIIGDADEVIEKVMNEIVGDTPGGELADFYAVRGDKGLAGYEFIIRSANGITHYRTLVDFRTLYILSVSTPGLTAPTKRITRFFDGFRVMI